MFDLILFAIMLALALIFGLYFIAHHRKIERIEATVQTLQEREEMRTVFHDPSISLKWGRKSVHTTTPQQINTDALAQVLQSRLSATQAVKLVQVLETDPEQIWMTQPSMRSLLARKH